MENDETPVTTEPVNPNEPPIESKKMAAGLCAILIGTLGIHKFILGYNTEGIIYICAFTACLILSFVTCGLGSILFIPMGAIPLVEGIIYLTKSDEEFIETYQKNKKAWF